MNNLIPLVNKLQDLFAKARLSSELRLPCIAVVGSQSSGKSSVLETIIGRDCLPRGAGMVTRRPLILQCRYSATEDYAMFLHRPNVKITNSEEIADEISRETERLLGNAQTVSPEPINMQLFSPDCVDLTLVDLPGMTRISMDGQASNVPELIQRMVREFVSDENCLILAVSAANTDLANSDALSLASIVDPQGKRTIGVLTKLDLMDHGLDAMEILSNKEVPLVNGWVGVVNRSQKDVKEKKSLSKQLQDEMGFFNNHPAYSAIASKCGIKHLREVLHEKLVVHIRNTIPKMKLTLQQQLREINQELRAKGVDESQKQKPIETKVIDLLNQYIYQVESMMDNRNLKSTDGMVTTAKINMALREKFAVKLLKSMNEDFLTDEVIKRAIYNCQGYNGGLFIPDGAYEFILRGQLGLLEKECLACIEAVKDELHGSVVEISGSSFKNNPSLMVKLNESTTDYLDELFFKVSNDIKMVVDVEVNCIDMKHPDLNINATLGHALDNRENDEDLKKQAAKPIFNDPAAKIEEVPAAPAADPNAMIKEGFLVKLGGKKTSAKTRYFTLTSVECCFYDEKAEKMLGDFPVDLIQVEEAEDEKGQTAIILTNSDGSNLFRNHEQLILYAETEEEHAEWVDAFKKLASKQAIMPVDPRQIGESTEDDLRNDFSNVNFMRNIILSYFRLTKKSIAMLIPKIIRNNFLNYFRNHYAKFTYGIILGEDKDRLEEYLEMSGAEQNMIKELTNKRDTIKAALVELAAV